MVLPIRDGNNNCYNIIRSGKFNLLILTKSFLVLFLLIIVNFIGLSAASTWDSFLVAHTIDPNEPQNSNYGMWNGAQWRQWLSDREPFHPALPRLTQKGINSVVVGSPPEILDAFNDQSHLLNDRFVWSSRRFRMYVFLMSHGGLQRVLDCLEMYFAVRLENGRPVHLHASNSQQIRTGNANYNFNTLCREI